MTLEKVSIFIQNLSILVWDIFDFNPSFDLKSSGASEALEQNVIFCSTRISNIFE